MAGILLPDEPRFDVSFPSWCIILVSFVIASERSSSATRLRRHDPSWHHERTLVQRFNHERLLTHANARA